MATPSIVLMLKELKGIIDDGKEMIVKKECIKELISVLEVIKELLEELESSSGELADENAKALAGLRENLRHAQVLLNKHKCKRRLYWIIWLHSLNQEVEEIVHGIGRSLVQVQSAKLPFPENSSAKLNNLIHKIEEVHYEATDNQESTIFELDVNSLLIKFSTDLGLNCERDKELLHRELRYFKADINDGSLESQKLVETVDEAMESLSCDISMIQEVNEAIPSFEAFECPLTKQIMKDPVVLQSEHTYERRAIEEWFEMCQKQNRAPTCPVSGQVLTTTALRSNIVLRQTIEEWYRRNVAARILVAGEKLKALDHMQDVDDALDEILRLANENHLNKFRLKEANLIPDIAKIWSLQGAAYFRAKALAVLDQMATDDTDNQDIIMMQGLLRSAVRSLGSREDEEKANAAKLLYHLSNRSEVCEKLGTQKGAIIHLVGLTASKDQDLASIAEKTLKNLEQVESNVLAMAEAGRLQPLLTRLCDGTEATQVEMAKFLAKAHLVKVQKKLVAQFATRSLLAMLSGTMDSKQASLGVLLAISTLEENRSLLIDAGILAPLLDMMFSIHSSLNALSLKLKENAAAIVANLVSTPGKWEEATINSEGTRICSESVIHNILGLMAHTKPDWKGTLLQTLIGLASSPETAEEACVHMRTGRGIQVCLVFLSEGSEASHRLNALKLLSVISVRLGEDIAKGLNNEGEDLRRLKALLKSKTSEERAAAACVLGNIPLTEEEVTKYFEPQLIGWILEALANTKGSKHGRSYTRLMCETEEGLLGILLHLLKSNRSSYIDELRQHDVMQVLVDQLDRQGQYLIKKRAAMGLKYLSEKALSLTRQPEPPSRNCFCFMPTAVKVCPVHLGMCDSVHSVCMVESKRLGDVSELLEEDDEGVQLAAVEALSTLLMDGVNLNGAVAEFTKADVVPKIFELFHGQKRGDTQDKTIWMIERILRVEEHAKIYSVDTRLFKSLVEAFKSGSPTTKALAQDSLTNLKQLSGVSAANRRKKTT